MPAAVQAEIMIAVIILVLYIKSGQCKRGCQHYVDPNVNERTSCRIFDEPVYEGIASKENGTEDTVGQCPHDQVQRFKNLSEHALVVLSERECPAGYEGMHGKEDGTDDKDRKYLPGKVHHDKFFSEYSFEGMLEQQCPEDTFNTSVQVKQRRGIDIYSFMSLRFCGIIYASVESSYNISTLKSPYTSNGSDVTRSAPTNIDTSQSSGKTSYIEWTQVIHTGSTIIFLLIITAVSITCVKCYIDKRLRTLNKATKNEHEPLHHQNDATYIPVEDLNANRTLVYGELQKLDLDDNNGNVDSSPESIDGQCEAETEGITVVQSNGSFHTVGPFCSCCGRHWKRCNNRNIKQSVARITPQQGINEMPPTETVEVEVLVDGYSNFSSNISLHQESHGSSNTDDEETTQVKSVYCSEQVSSTVAQTNEADGTCFEEPQQGDVDNEDPMTTGVPAESDLFRADSR